MKPDFHPKYHTDVNVTCACGNKFVTGSTVDAIHVEICSNCHPFFTGKSNMLDAAGRVDKFKARMERAKSGKAQQVKQPITGTLVEEQSQDTPETQKEHTNEE